MVIESTANEKFKRLKSLIEDNRERRKSGTFVVEGEKEVNAALHRKLELKTLFIEDGSDPQPWESIIPHTAIITLSKNLFAKCAYRAGTSQVIGIFKTPDLSLHHINVRKNPLVVILENVEKPGNLGAILRSCDATKVDAVIISGDQTHFFHPNVIRSSVGTVFTVPIAMAPPEDIYQWCKTHDIRIFAAALQDATLYTHEDFTSGTAFVMGAEDIGLSNFWREKAEKNIQIPMLGYNDSLNVSVSTAVLLYEAVRQRGI